MKVVSGSGALDAPILILRPSPTVTEYTRGTPNVCGVGGVLLNALSEVGIEVGSRVRTTFFYKALANNGDVKTMLESGKKKAAMKGYTRFFNGFFYPDSLQQWLDDLPKEIDQCGMNVIVAMGDAALWALGFDPKASKWRGSELTYCTPSGRLVKVVPTYDPAIVMKMWEWRKYFLHDLTKARMASESPDNWQEQETAYKYGLSFDELVAELKELYEWVSTSPIMVRLAVDLETRFRQIYCCGIAYSATEAVCVQLRSTYIQNYGYCYFSVEEEAELIEWLRKILTHPNADVVGQNFAYDQQYFAYQFGFLCNVLNDTMIMQHVLNAGELKSLDHLASMYLPNYVYWKDDGKVWDDPYIDDTKLWHYNCRDACATWEVSFVIEALIREAGLAEVYDFQMRQLWPAVIRMMLRGTPRNRRLTSTFSLRLMEEIAKREQALQDLTGLALNPRSPKALSQFFYDELKIEPVRQRKTGALTTDDDALQIIARREPLVKPIVKAIAEMRSLGVFLSTFINSPIDPDNCIRCYYNIAGTDTFRFSSSQSAFDTGGNLQNVPSGTEDDRGEREKAAKDPEYLLMPNARKLFVPPSDHIMFDVDLDRADLQVVVWEAEDDDLKYALREGIDLHILNGTMIKGIDVPVDELKESHPNYKEHKMRYAKERKFAKAFVHGTNYGGGARTMAINCGLTIAETEKAQATWFALHPGIKAWHKRTERQLLTDGYVYNAFGYRKRFMARSGNVLAEALAWNPQATVACIINRGLVNIDRNLPDVKLHLQVHDSLVGSFPRLKAKELLPEIRKNLLITVPYPDPLIIPVGLKLSSVSWGDCADALWE